MGGAPAGEGGEGDLGGGVLGLAEGGAEGGALEDLAIEVDGGLEPRRVVGPLPDAGVGGEVEAAPLRELLQLVLVHLLRRSPDRRRPDPEGPDPPAMVARVWFGGGLGFSLQRDLEEKEKRKWRE